MDHVCNCQSGKRSLVLIAAFIAVRYPELNSFCESGPEPIASDDRLLLSIGGCGKFQSLAEVVSFLRGVLQPDRLAGLRAAWLPAVGSVAEIDAALLAAKPLLGMVEVDSSPLLSMLTERRIETHFQPIFKAHSLDLWGYECLMRGRLADGKLVQPFQLIKWAKQEELVLMLDRVCRETHLLNAGKVDVPPHANLLINFMPTAIYKPEFCLQTTMAAADKSGIEPGRIIFEVVESEVVVDRPHLAHILRYYRENGFRVALDDLGSGYAGLSLLADLSPDLIKIDRELVNKAVTSHIHRAVCNALVRIGHDTGKLVLAEGVETTEESDVMHEAGADLFQGFYFGRPNAVPAMMPLQQQYRRAG